MRQPREDDTLQRNSVLLRAPVRDRLVHLGQDELVEEVVADVVLVEVVLVVWWELVECVVDVVVSLCDVVVEGLCVVVVVVVFGL